MAEDIATVYSDIYYLTNTLAHFRPDARPKRTIEDSRHLATLQHLATLLSTGTLIADPNAARTVAVTGRAQADALECSALLVTSKRGEVRNKQDGIEIHVLIDTKSDARAMSSAEVVLDSWQKTRHVRAPI